MYLTQEAAVDRVLMKFGMQASDHAKIPMEKGCYLLARAANLVSYLYSQLLNSLMYTMLFVRPDNVMWLDTRDVSKFSQGHPTGKC